MSSKTSADSVELGIMFTTQGFTVILDAKYDKLNIRADVIAAAKQHQIPLEIIHCTAPEEILRVKRSSTEGNRLNRRTFGDITDATAHLLSSQYKCRTGLG